ncbi:MAG TPA: GntR family transcriptional regulator [Devosia sp.]|jgi:DNA-binding GntR family transcriptional regulator|uniref:GntR family transcriptional regulator n=1 Tax=Devosia sp. TaxID=1871048 RepID=UPI002DDDA3A3|nr:GntR family transcriptional regulator [Devosia sp.]HEV2514151.1 GntR family transcriptional regulator [Devosia sp.]
MNADDPSHYHARPPAGIDASGASEEGASVYELIRDDIISGRLKANERLVVADLAARHGSSSNPVREALQLLRGQGFVTILPNRGARVRTIDQDFVRDTYEIGVALEPRFVRWFVGMATPADIAGLERLQQAMEANDFADPVLHSDLDTEFHTLMYERHYNRLAAEIWWKNREVLRAVTRSYSFTLARRSQLMREHRELIRLIRQGDADGAALLIEQHVEGAGRHVLEQLRATRAAVAS